jgi:hypothetical protein
MMAAMGKRCEDDWSYGFTVDVVIGDETWIVSG